MPNNDPYEGYYQRVRQIQRRRDEGLLSWWRRPGFTDPQLLERNPEAKPKWHAFQERVVRDPAKKWEASYVALCGYEHTFQEALLEIPLLRQTVKTAALRCSRCDRAVARGILPIDQDTVIVLNQGQRWRIHREDADPEHRFAAYRKAAEWFGNRPAPQE